MRCFTLIGSSRFLLPVAAVVLLLAGIPARAELQSFEFTGTIDFVDDSSGLLDPSIQIGSAVSGSYSVDSTNGGPGSDVGIGTTYTGIGVPPGTLSVSVEGLDYSNPIGVFISDGRLPRASQLVDAWTAITDNTAGTTQVAIVFYDSTGTKLSSESFFVNQTDEGWDTAEVWLTYHEDTGNGSTTPIRLATASISQAAPTSVPSFGPIGLILMSATILCAGTLATRRWAPGSGAWRAR